MDLDCLLVHGFSGAPTDLAPLAQAIAADHGADAVRCLTLPGHETGETPPFDLAAQTGAVSEALVRLRRRNRKTVVLGHSTGGALLLEALAGDNWHPDLLVLAGVPKQIDLAYLERWQRHRADRGELSLTTVSGLVSLINRVGRRPVAGSSPVLVLHGARDDLVPAATVQEWLQGVFAGPLRTRIIPQASHRLFLGAGGALAIEAVVRALSDVLEVPDSEDVRVVARLREVEPESGPFLDRTWGTALHLGRSPAGRSLVGAGIELGEQAESEPIFANVEITTACNLGCRHCARRFGSTEPKHMAPEDFQRILEALPHAYRVTLVGLGEPLLHPRVTELVTSARRLGRRTALATNAMELDPGCANALLDAGLDSIVFSLDAPTAKLAHEVRAGTDLERVTTNIRHFTELAGQADRPISTAVFSAVSMATLPALVDLVDLVRGLGVHVLMLSDLNFRENSASTLWRNADAGMAATVRRAVSHAFGAGLPVLSVRGLEEFGLANRYREALLVPPTQLYQRSAVHRFCRSPWQTVPVDVEGNITLCDCQPNRPIGNVLRQPLHEIWNGAALRRYRLQMTRGEAPPGPCALCPRF